MFSLGRIGGDGRVLGARTQVAYWAILDVFF
jgi:hypothetical protein